MNTEDNDNDSVRRCLSADKALLKSSHDLASIDEYMTQIEIKTSEMASLYIKHEELLRIASRRTNLHLVGEDKSNKNDSSLAKLLGDPEEPIEINTRVIDELTRSSSTPVPKLELQTNPIYCT